jgi:recombination protein RecA
MGVNLDAVIKETNKKLKKELVTHGAAKYNYSRIPFSSPKLNYMTYGGLPLGSIVEFFGLESSGKTTTALDIVANAQKLFKTNEEDKKVLFVDVENSFDTEWAQKLGVDTDDLIMFSPKEQTAEEILEIILAFIDTGEIGLAVLDSIGVLLSNSEFTEDLDKSQYGGISKVLSKFVKKATQSVAKNHCLLLCINQCRDNLGSMYGGLTTPGGHAFKFMCMMRLMFQHGKFIDEKGSEVSGNTENPFGNIINVKIEKTKCCAPDRRLGHYTLRYDSGIDAIGDFVDIGMLYGLVIQGGAWFSVIDPDTGELMNFNDKDLKFQGKPKLIAALKEDQELLDFIKAKLDILMYPED